MDYSLLLGVQNEQVYLNRDGLMERWDSFGQEQHQNDTPDGYEWVDLRDLEGGNPQAKKTPCIVSPTVVQVPRFYFFGLIDVLQQWNFKKRMERFCKRYFQFSDDTQSAIEPIAYQERFMQNVIHQRFNDSNDQNRTSVQSLTQVPQTSV